MLRKYIPDPNHVVDYEPLKLRDDLTYGEQEGARVEVSYHTLCQGSMEELVCERGYMGVRR